MEKKRKLNIFKDFNMTLLFLTIFFAVGGAFLILDASSISSVLRYGLSTPYYFFYRQLAFIIVTLVGSLFVILINTKNYKKLSVFFMLPLTAALIYYMIENKLITSNISELKLSFFQPAEFLKVFVIMYMGSFYGSWCNRPHKKWSFIIPIIVCMIICGVVLLGGDFGSAAIFAALCVLILMVVPLKKEDKWFRKIRTIGLVCLVLAVFFLKFGYKIIPEKILQSDYRLNRFIYTNPCDRYEEDTGYQVCNGYIAINNGGFTGLGPGNSIQKYLYLPESHTDFIFPIIIEEFGAITGIFIIVGYIVIIVITFKIAVSCYDLQNSIICYGVGIYFMLHIFVNLGGVLGIIPLTGVPLPFLSYGGSFCVSILASFAIVQRINKENNIEKRRREIKNIVGK